jgi:hypothetical protein
MFDTLDGLDYKPGECSAYVASILSDMTASIAKGDIVRCTRDEIKVGDVIVADYSSHLVTDEEHFPRVTVRRDSDEDQDPTYFTTRKHYWVIPDVVLRRKRAERNCQN